MLQLITGRSGSGKTAEVFCELKQKAAEGARLFLLVPEQASYENERRLLTELGPVLSQRVQVLSFTRMADIVFREVGVAEGKRMDATLSLLLLSQALHSVAASLKLYKSHVDSPEYLRALADVLVECKQCTITPAMLETTALALPIGLLLKDKLSELALIFGAYEALVAQASLVDPLDNLTLLAHKLPESHTFDGAYVYIDGFLGFTGQEMAVLEKLMPHVEALTVTLCTDELRLQDTNRFDRFASTGVTVKKLFAAADRARVRKPLEKRCTENRRTAVEALRVLEAGCFEAETPVFEDATDAVMVAACRDRSEECRYAARLIRRLLREENGYCRDFTVVSRAPEQYDDLMEAALRREGLPCCRDQREAVLTQPLITLVEAALAAVTQNFDSGDVLRMVKSGLAGFSATSASLLENYVFTWNIHGKEWLTPFTENPDGLTDKITDKTESRLAYLNVLRQRLAKPLSELSERLSGVCSGKQFAEAVYVFLEDLRVARSVKLQVARLDNDREFALADRGNRLWEYLMALLDKFALGLADVRLPAARLAELFHLAVSNDDLGSIPQGLDGVVLGSVNHIRYTEPKTVIILGANEGVLPAYPSMNGLLTDFERRRLIEAQLPVSDCADSRTTDERFYAYAAVAAPSKRLVVTYSERNGKDEMYPSTLVAEIRRLVKNHTVELPKTVLCESEEDAFAVLAAQYRENTPEAAAYRHVFADRPLYRARLEAMERLEKSFAFKDAAAAEALFGKAMRLSPSQVQEFSECRFAYFCNHGLGLKLRRAARISGSDAGSIAHYLLQNTVPAYMKAGIESVTREQIREDTVRLVNAYVNALGGKNNRNATFDVQLERLTEKCDLFLWRVVKELQQSRFAPVDYELNIGSDQGIPAWNVPLDNGASIQLIGRVDRVVALKKDGRTYLRVMDYKTGDTTFDVSCMLAGLDVQLLLYLFAVCQNGGERYGEELYPAGMFYIPADTPAFVPEGPETPEELEKKRLKAMCSSGLMLGDPAIIEAMEAELQGVFIPVSTDKKGNLDTKNLATIAQFGKLKERMEEMLKAMVATLHAGDIAAVPKAKKDSPCGRCHYRDICGREEHDPLELIAKLSLDEAFAEEVGDDE